MDWGLTEEETQLRNRFLRWLAANLPSRPLPEEGRDGIGYWQALRQWQRRLFEGGWAGLSWPVSYGGQGASERAEAMIFGELAAQNVPERIGVIGESLVGPTLIAEGSEEQRRFFLPRILDGSHLWCQGFTEPEAGSDLQSLTTRAERRGDGYVVEGRKIWTSYAAVADWCLLLAKTPGGEADRRSVSCFLVDMKSPGIAVRPIRRITGDRRFGELTFSGVAVPAHRVLGKPGEGWRIAMRALEHERIKLGLALYERFHATLTELIAKVKAARDSGETRALSRGYRSKIAQAYAELQVFRAHVWRVLSSRAEAPASDFQSALLKLFWSEMNQRLVQTALAVLGDRAQLETYDNGIWIHRYLRARGDTIEAGTSEIMRGLIARRALKLGADMGNDARSC